MRKSNFKVWFSLLLGLVVSFAFCSSSFAAQAVQKVETETFVVKKGDNMTKLAKRHHMSLKAFCDLNKDMLPEPGNNDLILAGQKLLAPKAEMAAGKPVAPSAATATIKAIANSEPMKMVDPAKSESSAVTDAEIAQAVRLIDPMKQSTAAANARKDIVSPDPLTTTQKLLVSLIFLAFFLGVFAYFAQVDILFRETVERFGAFLMVTFNSVAFFLIQNDKPSCFVGFSEDEKVYILIDKETPCECKETSIKGIAKFAKRLNLLVEHDVQLFAFFEGCRPLNDSEKQELYEAICVERDEVEPEDWLASEAV